RLTGDASGAVVALEHADALQPLRDADVVRLAELYLEAGADASARSRLRRIKPDSAEYARAQDLVGVVAARAGRLDEALAAFERAAGDDPRDPGIVARLAEVSIAAGDRERGIRRYREAVALGAP